MQEVKVHKEQSVARPPALPRIAPPGNRWGVILAGGDGSRLQALTRFICGDDRPKQFCPLFGADTLLEQTRRRVERSIRPNQILFSLTRSHRDFYLEEPNVAPSQRIVQPANRGTAPPLLHSLLSIERLDRNAIVAVLPSDHYYSDEDAFTGALESAFAIALVRCGSVVLIGALPDSPEVEYGWIEVGSPAYGEGSFHVQRFCEKPSFHVARELLLRGALWNTFVMVGHVSAFVEMMRISMPGLAGAFPESDLWAEAEVHIGEPTYQGMHSVDFSQAVLSVQTRRLIALQLDHTRWSDLGHPARVMTVLESNGLEPHWMKKWEPARRRPPAAAESPYAALAVM